MISVNPIRIVLPKPLILNLEVTPARHFKRIIIIQKDGMVDACAVYL
jgi:hypothetical protein